MCQSTYPEKPQRQRNLCLRSVLRLTRADWIRLGVLAILLIQFHQTFAATFPIMPANSQLIGGVQVIQARQEDTLMDIARLYSLGFGEITKANPDVDPWLPGEATQVIIPSRFILPDAPREGIVLNRGEMRLYYFHHDAATGNPMVTTYPVGIGRADRQTPIGRSRIVNKLQNPTWYPTRDVRADYAARGLDLPLSVPPGPDNPLGEYALVLDRPGYMIHGTNRPDGIGMRVSQGCIRLYPEDIAALVSRVEAGTQVTIVDQPYKLAVSGGRLLVEVHPVVYPAGGEKNTVADEQHLIEQISLLLAENGDQLAADVDWGKVTEVLQAANGLPTVVTRSERYPLLPDHARR